MLKGKDTTSPKKADQGDSATHMNTPSVRRTHGLSYHDQIFITIGSFCECGFSTHSDPYILLLPTVTARKNAEDTTSHLPHHLPAAYLRGIKLGEDPRGNKGTRNHRRKDADYRFRQSDDPVTTDSSCSSICRQELLKRGWGHRGRRRGGPQAFRRSRA